LLWDHGTGGASRLGACRKVSPDETSLGAPRNRTLRFATVGCMTEHALMGHAVSMSRARTVASTGAVGRMMQSQELAASLLASHRRAVQR
jgi:hypothetical protein